MSFDEILAHQRRGDGPNITLMLHGFLGMGRNLSSLARRWSERDPTRTFVLLDMTGHGTSPALPNPPTLDAIARDVLKFAAFSFGDDAISIVGHSMGGRVALSARQLAPHSVSAVTLIDISPSPHTEKMGSLEPVLDALLAAPNVATSRDMMRDILVKEGLSRSLSDWLVMNLAKRAGGGVGWRFDRQALKKLYLNSRGVNLWDTIELGPTLAVRGEKSTFVSNDHLQRMEALGATTKTVPNAGHFVHVDAQNALLDILVANAP